MQAVCVFNLDSNEILKSIRSGYSANPETDIEGAITRVRVEIGIQSFKNVWSG